MTLEIVVAAGAAARCALSLAQAVAYRHRSRARAELLTAAASLPAGSEIAEQTAGGDWWSVIVCGGKPA
ncbi:Uncharacterised protein [Amycolatopsis camponoti]|uniref:Uncharacterized protein n=1 Tax=Amycolatopsis camponoti TaxID=2606593 RepID=A0A6I8LX52_9PSEU|nr:hypothetical protein [Amycolatopsis camponoti]VVJ22762.1 Uncharacterised protein [Amycolatopsis camponoti]